MRVELDIFSGRPNPAWDLTAAEQAECLARLRALPPTDAQPPINDGLGYRGFVVTDEPALKAQVYRGCVRLAQGAARRVVADPQRTLEHWLLQTGKPYLESAVYQAVQADLTRAP